MVGENDQRELACPYFSILFCKTTNTKTAIAVFCLLPWLVFSRLPWDNMGIHNLQRKKSRADMVRNFCTNYGCLTLDNGAVELMGSTPPAVLSI
jgi:hypothetical protein